MIFRYYTGTEVALCIQKQSYANINNRRDINNSNII